MKDGHTEEQSDANLNSSRSRCCKKKKSTLYWYVRRHARHNTHAPKTKHEKTYMLQYIRVRTNSGKNFRHVRTIFLFSWVEPEQCRWHLVLGHRKSHISDLMLLPLSLRALRAVAFICHDVSYKHAWSTHRYHVSVGVSGGVVVIIAVVRVVTLLVSDDNSWRTASISFKLYRRVDDP